MNQIRATLQKLFAAALRTDRAGPLWTGNLLTLVLWLLSLVYWRADYAVFGTLAMLNDLWWFYRHLQAESTLRRVRAESEDLSDALLVLDNPTESDDVALAVARRTIRLTTSTNSPRTDD